MKKKSDDGIVVTKHGNRVSKQDNHHKGWHKDYHVREEDNAKPKTKDRHYHRIIVKVPVK